MVVDAIETTYGKYPVLLGNVIVMDVAALELIQSTAAKLIRRFFPQNASMADLIESTPLSVGSRTIQPKISSKVIEICIRKMPF
jgi:hypothetical protein